MARVLVILVSLVLSSLPALAQLQRLTLEELFDPNEKIDLSGTPQNRFTWLDEREFLWSRTDSRGRIEEFLVVDAATGRQRIFFDRERMQKALLGIEGMTEEKASGLLNRSHLFDPSHQGFLLIIEGDLYAYRWNAAQVRRLTRTPAKDEVPSFSPDGRMVAFVRDNDLFVLDLASGEERRLTTGGSPELFQGKFDWVYQEEIYGRGDFKAYWWSPDSRSIAYLRLDESPVGEFLIVDQIPYLQDVERMKYPKAGDPNPLVSLRVADVASGESRDLDLSHYAEEEILIVNVSWTPDSGHVVFQVQNRQQTWLDLNLASRDEGPTKTLFRETTPAWVDVHGGPEWLEDGTFLWFSERDGWKHLYHVRGDGSVIRQVTRGEWEARSFHGIDEENQWVYFSGTERSPIAIDVYRIRLDGTRLERLSQKRGTHAAHFDPSLRWYLDRWSNLETPQQVRLHRSDGTELRKVHVDAVPLLERYALSKPEFLKVKTRDGFPMEALLIRPLDFDPAKKYPVFQYIYGGPHAQTVRDAWPGGRGGTRHWFHQLLAQRGIIVWMIDNRTASGKGAVSTWPVYRNFGELELRDVEDGLAWLRSQPWVDGSRIMINGWSYGGFMTSYALTHSTSFRAGIAGGTVTDWRDYDTIYTERYMDLPQDNEEGYKKSSPRWNAKDLHGDLLLIHGTIDENVHMQNTLQFALELQKAGKPFRMMLYPKNRHGITDDAQNAHMYRMMFDFIIEQLQPDGVGVAPEAPQAN